MFKPPYPTFSQFISTLNYHELRVNSYEDSNVIDHNLAFVGTKEVEVGVVGMVEEVDHGLHLLFLKVVGSYLSANIMETQIVLIQIPDFKIQERKSLLVTLETNYQNPKLRILERIQNCRLKLPQRTFTQIIF